MFAVVVAVALFALGNDIGNFRDSGATQVIERACNQREALVSGCVEVRQVLRIDDAVVFSWGRVTFQGDLFRMDVLDCTEAQLSESSWKTAPIKESLIWDGSRILSRTYQPTSFPFTIRPMTEATFFFFHPALLGLPGHPKTFSDVRACMRSDWEIARKPEQSNSEARTELVPNPNSDVTGQDLSFLFDMTKSGSVVGYELESKRVKSGNTYNIIGTSELEVWDNTWYPRHFKLEQLRNGLTHWTLEYEVIAADFSVSIDPSIFTWAGLGIVEGQPIISSDPTTPSFEWGRAGGEGSRAKNQQRGN